jgi:signal transduction histidine kinase
MTELSPPVLNELGFLSAVEWLTEQMKSKHGIKIEFKRKCALNDISHEIQILLFQAIRELFMNIVKHANTDSAAIKISETSSNIRVEIKDNGVGLKKQKFGKDNNAGFGLFGIRERLKHFDGKMYIQSRPGKGTMVVLFVPRLTHIDSIIDEFIKK